MKVRAERLCAGEYNYRVGDKTVAVSQVPPNEAYGDKSPMWIAVATWSQYIFTDPLPTKREAVEAAYSMLAEATNDAEADYSSSPRL